MASPLFQNNPQSQNNGIFGLINQLGNGNPNAFLSQITNEAALHEYQTNPEFRDFANSMRGKTPTQAFREKGFDFNQFRGQFRA